MVFSAHERWSVYECFRDRQERAHEPPTAPLAGEPLTVAGSGHWPVGGDPLFHHCQRRLVLDCQLYADRGYRVVGTERPLRLHRTDFTGYRVLHGHWRLYSSFTRWHAADDFSRPTWFWPIISHLAPGGRHRCRAGRGACRPNGAAAQGFYLGIVTLALVFIGQYLFMNLRGITGGPQGRTFPVPAFGDFSFSQQNDFLGLALTPGQQYFLLLLVILGLAALFVGNVMRSRAGRVFRATRDHEVGAAVMGINLFEAKMGAFILSSFLAGIAGALLASYTSYITPNYWDLTLSIQFVAAILIGGIASIWGSLLGAAFVFGLPQVIDYFSLLPTGSAAGGLTSGNLNALIYGFLIIVFLLFEPGGVIGLVHRCQALIRKFKQQGGEGGELAEIIDLSPVPGEQVNLEDAAHLKRDSE